jgi:CBS domain-containing protein
VIAADFMTTSIVSTTPDATVERCAELMLENGVSALPVLNAQQELVGIVSEGDLLHRAELGTDKVARPWWLGMLATRRSLADDYVHSHSKHVRDVMTSKVLAITSTASLTDIASMLESNRIKRLPVVDGGRLVGIVSRANLVQALASRGRALKVTKTIPTDSSIRNELLDVLSKESWASSVHNNVIVTDGTVEFYGLVDSENERKAAQVAAENIAGVKEVIDHRVLSSSLPSGA